MTTRVLSISTLFPAPGRSKHFGGFVARQFEALIANGDVDLTVINPQPAWSGGSSSMPDTSRGYPVHRPRYWSIPRLGARWNPAAIACAALPIARRLHAERPFDVVDAQFFYPDGPATARIAKVLGVPLSIKARGSDIHFWGGKSFARRQILNAAQAAAGILSVSEALRHDMAALGIDARKVAVHYTGLDHALFHPRDRAAARCEVAAWNPANEITPVPADGHLLVATGNLIPLKGQSLVIAALSELPGARLLLAGSGPDHAALRQQAAALGLADRVHFGSYAPEDLAIALAAADVMVLPSEREGLANAWLEALACGTPLVITDVGGAREVVRSESAGRIVERSESAIVAAVRDLIAVRLDPEIVASNAARFSWEANAAQLAEHYRKVAAS